MNSERIAAELLRVAKDIMAGLGYEVSPKWKTSSERVAGPYDKMTFRFFMGDRVAELLMKRLQDAGYQLKPDKRNMLAFTVTMNRNDAKRFKGIYAYRYSDKWQGFGPGALEGIEYMVVSKGKKGKVALVRYKGYYEVYTPFGEKTVPVKGEIVDLKQFDPDTIRKAVEEDIQWYLDDNPDDWMEDWMFEDMGEE